MSAPATEPVVVQAGNDPEDSSDDTQEVDGQEAPTTDENKVDDLPEWARKKLTSANSEAANYRVQLRDAQASLAKAKTIEEFTAATTELQQQIVNLEAAQLRASVAGEFNLPAALVDRLQGSNETELRADAKALSELVQSKGTKPGLKGGLDPNDDEGEMNPRQLAQLARHRW